MSSGEDGTTEDLHIPVHRIDIDSTPPGVAPVCITYDDDWLCSSDDDDLVNVGKMAIHPIHVAKLEC